MRAVIFTNRTKRWIAYIFHWRKQQWKFRKLYVTYFDQNDSLNNNLRYLPDFAGRQVSLRSYLYSLKFFGCKFTHL